MENMSKSYAIPISVVVAAVIIGGSVFVARYDGGKSNESKDIVMSTTKFKEDNISPVTTNDHILGDPMAPLKIVEFSDLECPYCKNFHPTMKRIMDEYGKKGEVAWIYRHLPIDSIHPKSRKEAEAAECAGEVGSNQKFWEFVDRLFEVTPSNNGLDPNKLFEIADYIKLDKEKFKECFSSGKYAEHIESNLQDAISSGADGTPYSILIDKEGEKTVLSGALSYADMKQAIEIALNKNKF